MRIPVFIARTIQHRRARGEDLIRSELFRIARELPHVFGIWRADLQARSTDDGILSECNRREAGFLELVSELGVAFESKSALFVRTGAGIVVAGVDDVLELLQKGLLEEIALCEGFNTVGR